jgi:hypothetical protein
MTVLGFCAMAPVSAPAQEASDLREFRIGMSAAELPQSGYTDFICGGDPTRRLADWTSWRTCPADTTGLRAIGFKYDESMRREGTKVAGHPVVLTLVIGGDARVTGLVIETDPKARLFQRKKAFLLGLQAKARYGDEGWSCSQEQPAGDEAPIGETFVKEECTKRISGRSVTVRRELYRNAKEGIRAFVGRTRISILKSE